MRDFKQKRKKYSRIHFSSRLLFALNMVSLLLVILLAYLIGGQISEKNKALEIFNGNTNINLSKIEQLNDRINAQEKLIESFDEENVVTFSMFTEFGVIGDSHASGVIETDNGMNEHISMSWGQILARRNGNKCVNFSKGGTTTRSWLDEKNDLGLKMLNESNPLGLYFLAFGINDCFRLGQEYIGNIKDIHDGNPEQNADTFYGNYGRIIEAILQKNSNAKMIMMTMADNYSEDAIAYNNAITEIAEHYGIPCICLYEDSYFKSEFYKENMRNAHPVAVTYSGMAVAIEKMSEKVMMDDIKYFIDYTG